LKTSELEAPTAVLAGFGGSVTGPEHVRLGHPNQDAWRLRKADGSIMAAVADGLGSAKHGDFGAKAACVAAMEAFRLAHRAGIPPTWHSIAVLRAAWHQLVARWGAEHCGTTCLACFIDSRGALFAAQVGDGIVAIRRSDGNLSILPRKDKAFQNTTETIASRGAQEWSILSDAVQPGDAVFMATDGISDDLDPSKIGDFIAHLQADYLPLPAATRSSRIRSALKKWPTRHHRDDKTFVILARTS
jgi:serine/threonine protein phosphatase PrpC